MHYRGQKKTKKKNDGKTGIFMQNQFSTKSIFLYGCNSKTNNCKFLKFSPNIYISSNFQNILTSFELFIDHRNFRFFLKCR
ncbi:Uncharacterized protein FWK35_00000046 [Aphis craccivora]|uniref:Uncharacterized protein n=1 Tax=Aphis craccivora TaxID=307492 RepID=A0A6G0ZQH4_APHCR|nr:Uncharacterized protein FWK35_00000046 [Aphis craccivora]